MNAADALIANGAKDVYAYITHGVLSGGAAARIACSKLKELVITNSILPTDAVNKAANIRTLSIAPLIARSHQPHRGGRVGVEPVRLEHVRSDGIERVRFSFRRVFFTRTGIHFARKRYRAAACNCAGPCAADSPDASHSNPGRGTRFISICA